MSTRRLTGGNGARRGNGHRVNRIISNKLRMMHLTSEPAFHLCRPGPNAQVSPLPYIGDVSYVRKVRFVSKQPAGTNYAIKVKTLMDQVWFDRPATGSFVPFSRAMITRIDVWGSAVANAGILVLPQPVLLGVAATGGPNKDWSDFGVQNSRRPRVTLEASPKDLAWVNTFITNNDQDLVIVRCNEAQEVVVDLLVHFSGSGAVTVFDQQGKGFEKKIEVVGSSPVESPQTSHPHAGSSKMGEQCRAFTRIGEDVSGFPGSYDYRDASEANATVDQVQMDSGRRSLEAFHGIQTSVVIGEAPLSHLPPCLSPITGSSAEV